MVTRRGDRGRVAWEAQPGPPPSPPNLRAPPRHPGSFRRWRGGPIVGPGTFPAVGLAAAVVWISLAAARRATDSMDPGWPHVLTALVPVVVVGSAFVSVVMFRRARASLSDGRPR